MFGNQEKNWDSAARILQQALEYKEKGNAAVGAQKWPQASLAYKTGNMLLKDYVTKPQGDPAKTAVEAGGGEADMATKLRGKPKLSPEDQKSVNDLSKVLHLNLSLVQLNMGKTTAAIESANTALFYDPENPKALFRRGCAHLAKKDTEPARADFLHILQIVPGDATATAKLEETAAVEASQKNQEKKMFSKMFG